MVVHGVRRVIHRVKRVVHRRVAHTVRRVVHRVRRVVVQAQNGSNPEKNGIKTILVSLEAEFFVEQHIQNPLKSAPGKSC